MATSIESTSVSSSLSTALSSMASEITVLLIFFVTWSVFNFFLRNKKAVSSEKVAEQTISFGKSTQTPQALVQMMQGMCADQFTRGLRLYRQLVKTDQDKHIVEESFYTALVEGAIRVGKADVAQQVIVRMKENNMVPSTGFVQSLLKLFAARKFYKECIEAGKLFDIPEDQVVYSCMIVASSELGDITLAKELLERSGKLYQISSRDYVPLVRAHARKGDPESAVALIRSLMANEVEIESIVLNTALASWNGNNQDPKLMYNLLCDMREYEKRFKNSCVDSVSYNSVMKSLARNRDVTACFELLGDMCNSGVQPDDISFSTLLDVCIDTNEHDFASRALEKMCASGIKMNCVLLTTMMKGFIRVKQLDMAMNLFNTMRGTNSAVKPDMITYSVLIKAHCDGGDMATALQILEDMLQNSCDVDDVVFTHLIEGCCHISNVALAEKLFHDMRAAKIKPSIFTFTAMVKVYGKCQQSEKAWEMVSTMESDYGLKPTVVIVTCLISGLLRQKKIREAYSYFTWMNKNGIFPDTQCAQTIIVGLADAQMYQELREVVSSILTRKPPLQMPDCLNQTLAKILAAGNTKDARAFHALLVQNKVAITDSNAARLA